MSEGRFGPMTDREILVELATVSDGTRGDIHDINLHLKELNGSVAKQGKKIVALEVGQAFTTKRSIFQWGGMFGAIGALVAGGFYAFGQAISWW